MDALPPHESQTASRSFADELRQLLRLGVPIAFVQLGLTGLNFVDLAMLGHFDAASLPAMALGNTVGWIVSMFCMGALAAADAAVAPLAGDDAAALDAVVPLALGVLMHRFSLTRRDALARLRRTAAADGRSLQGQAERVVQAVEELADRSA